MQTEFNLRQFVLISLVVSIWIHVSEATRFFGFVAPQMRTYLAGVPDLIPLTLPLLLVWGAWDMLLTMCAVFVCWLVVRVFGDSMRSILLAATVSSAFFFGLFWVSMVLMALSPLPLAITAIAFAWVEMVVASYLAAWLYRRGFAAGR
jgi:hypothetical protein